MSQDGSWKCLNSPATCTVMAMADSWERAKRLANVTRHKTRFDVLVGGLAAALTSGRLDSRSGLTWRLSDALAHVRPGEISNEAESATA